MKKLMIVVGLVSILYSGFSFSLEKSKIYCGKDLVEKKAKEYLKEEALEANVVTLVEKQTKKPVFGYIVDAIRNDTNFIYTRLSYDGDTLVKREFHDFKISSGIDSIVTQYICTGKGLTLHRIQQFYDGEKLYDTTLVNKEKR